MSDFPQRPAYAPYPLVPGTGTGTPSPREDETNPKDALASLKPDLALVPPVTWVYLAKVMELGAAKYGAYNWRSKKVRRLVYLAAALRHILTDLDGEEVDPESGQPHLAHAMACMAIVLDARSLGKLVDDRPSKGSCAQLIREVTRITK